MVTTLEQCLGTRQVIVTVQLLFVEATIVSVFSVVIVTVQLLFVKATIVSVFSVVIVTVTVCRSYHCVCIFSSSIEQVRGRSCHAECKCLQSWGLNVNRLGTGLSSMQIVSSMISNYASCCYGNNNVWTIGENLNVVIGGVVTTM